MSVKQFHHAEGDMQRFSISRCSISRYKVAKCSLVSATVILLLVVGVWRTAGQVVSADEANSVEKRSGNIFSLVPDPKQLGGEPDSVVQVANLVYAGVKSSQRFSDHFLISAEKESAISTSRRLLMPRSAEWTRYSCSRRQTRGRSLRPATESPPPSARAARISSECRLAHS